MMESAEVPPPSFLSTLENGTVKLLAMAKRPRRTGTRMPFRNGHHLRMWEVDIASYKYGFGGISLRSALLG